jgi:hypothetical protein
MRNRMWISLIGIILALGAGSQSASARWGHHRYRHVRTVYTIRRHVSNRPVYVVRRPIWRRNAWRRHAWIMGNRQTHVYYVQRVSNSRPSRANRIYFSSAADARAAGYQPAGRGVVPIDPRLTWQNGRSLPSLGKHREPPPPPKWIQKPASPPTEQQPKVTPTEPMPN